MRRQTLTHIQRLVANHVDTHTWDVIVKNITNVAYVQAAFFLALFEVTHEHGVHQQNIFHIGKNHGDGLAFQHGDQ